MNGIVFLSSASLAGSSPPWQVGGTGDFNSDGMPDIVWYNPNTGAGVIWFMNGINVSYVLSLPAQTDLAKRMVGTGHFNNDGLFDIIWRNDSTGATEVWLMAGSTRLAITTISPPGPDPAWRLVAAADFNKDRKTDLAWWKNDGLIEVWLMNGTTRSSVSVLGVLDTQWRVVGPR